MAEKPIRPAEVCRGRDLAVLGIASNHTNRQAQPLDQGGIVGQAQVRPGCCGMSFAQDLGAEDLRGLSQPNVVTGDRGDDPPVRVDSLQCVGRRRGYDAGAMLRRCRHRRLDDIGVDEWPRCIMDGHQLGVGAFEPVADGVLPLRTAGHQPHGTMPRAELVEPSLGADSLTGRNGYDHAGNSRAAEESAQRMNEERNVAQQHERLRLWRSESGAGTGCGENDGSLH